MLARFTLEIRRKSKNFKQVFLDLGKKNNIRITTENVFCDISFDSFNDCLWYLILRGKQK